MSAGAPWSVKGIDPKAREIAKDLARRSGMTLGEWLNQVIMEDGDSDLGPQTAPAPEPAPALSRTLRDRFADTVAEEPLVAAEELARVNAALDRLTSRIESAEHRSTLAISGIDQSVHGLLSRLEAAERDQVAVAARFEGQLDEIRAEQARSGERLVRVEEEAMAPKSLDAMRSLEAAIGKVAAHVYDSESRARTDFTALRGEIAGVTSRVERLDQQVRAGGDPAAMDGVVSRIVSRLEQAEARTSEAIRSLETSFADLDGRMRRAETRNDGPERRLEELAVDLAENFEATRREMAERLKEPDDGRLDAIEASLRDVSGQVEAIEASVRNVSGHVEQAERRSTQAIEKMGHEVLRMAEGLGKRMHGVETRSTAAIESVSGDVSRIADAMEIRLRRADAMQAESLERLGGEIAKITERLAERIATAERRSAQAMDDVGEKVARVTERLHQRHEQASSDIAERIRQSEERTARLLEEARERIDGRLSETQRRIDEQASRPVYAPAPAAPQGFYGDADLPPGPFHHDIFAAAPEPAPQGFAAQDFQSQTFEPQAFSQQAFDADYEAQQARFSAPAAPPPQFGAEDFEAADEFEPYGAPQAPAPAADDDLEIAPDRVSGFDGVEEDPAEAYTGTQLSTRELIAQARAAARASSQDEAEKGKPFSFSFGKKKEKPKGGGPLKTALLMSGAAAALGVSAFGLTLLNAQWVHGSRKAPGAAGALQIAQDAQSLTPPADAPLDAAGTVTTPNAAIALSPQPILGGGDAANASLYADAVRRIEGHDATGVADLRRAANLGYAPAQFYLAKLYETGDSGVPRDAAEARRWTERAALNGDRKAMHNLALYYFEGTGGKKDTASAAEWFRKAADLGLPDSQFNLARLYEEGLGVAKNQAEAYKWYLVAARAGDSESRSSAERLKAGLSNQARATAENAARGFRAQAPLGAGATAAAALASPDQTIQLAQRALTRLGYYSGPQDGKASPALKLAIASWQHDQGGMPTGKLDQAAIDRFTAVAR